eukprot:4568703-Alexandrium_andersonii.AAC.1
MRLTSHRCIRPTRPFFSQLGKSASADDAGGAGLGTTVPRPERPRFTGATAAWRPVAGWPGS